MTAPQTLAAGEPALRRQIDASLSRAMFDRTFATMLLADPELALADSGCTPQQHVELRGIQANSLFDFARQAEALFWLAPVDPHYEEDALLPAAAAM